MITLDEVESPVGIVVSLVCYACKSRIFHEKCVTCKSVCKKCANCKTQVSIAAYDNWTIGSTTIPSTFNKTRIPGEIT